MNDNQPSQVKFDKTIVIICEKCWQKLRVPRINKIIHVTCPSCRYQFDYLHDNEFYLITPLEFKLMFISLVMIAVGGIFSPLINSWARSGLPIIIALPFVMMVPFGVIILIVFGVLALLQRNDIALFSSIKSIVLSKQGVALYQADGGINRLIYWKQVKTIRLQYLRHMFLGVIEARREPTRIIFTLTDRSNFTLPIYMILKKQDRRRMISTLSSYVAF